MDHLRSIFQDISFTNGDQVIEALQQEGLLCKSFVSVLRATG